MSELIACHHKVTLDIAKRDVCTIEVVNQDTANILEVNVCENGKEVSLENATLVTITYSNDTVDEMQISEDFKTAFIRINANCLKRGINFAKVCIYSGDNGLITAEMLTINCKQTVGSDNPSVPDPDMPKLKEMIAELVKQSASSEQIAAAVSQYLKDNPITETDPTVPDWAKEKNKPTYTAAEVGALSEGTLDTAINEALAAAKASGEFDGADGITPTIGDNGNWFLGDVDTNKPSRGETGARGEKGADGATGATGADGKSAYSYAQDGGYTGTESEFAAKLAAEIPTVDETLTEPGKAADAKAVGDAINLLSEEIVGHVSVEPEGEDIPKVYFTGTLPTSKAENDVKLTMHYISKTADFIYPVTLKVQGSSSVNYPKKNFTLKLYEDATYESKKKLAFKNWPQMNKFVLKAHWIDHSHVRNVGTAKIWGKIVKSRSDYNSLPEELRNSPNNGATDGFTVKVFANGVYQGLYEWIVPKDKLFGQDSAIATHSILNSELNNQPTCAFATTSPTVSGNWSEELQDSLSSDISTSFSNMIKFVAGSTDEAFVENAENYFDVQSVIDYNIFARIFCIVDNLCRNQIFFTYDGAKWYEGVWDLDAILGLPPTNRGFFAYNTEFQTGYIAYKDYGVTNLLYQRVETLFMDRFKARYAELRSNVLSIENILDVYERLTDVITTYDGLLAEDYASTTGDGAFTGIPYKTENTIQQIRNFVAQRIPYMDEVVEAMSQHVPCTGISLNTDTLTFTSKGSQTLIATVTPDGCTDVVTWESNNTSVATVNGGVVTAVTNGNATITARCGDYSATCAVTVSGIEISGDIIEDGLVMHLDAIKNVSTGHDKNATVWSDLSGNGNDATISYTSNAPEWNENGLVFGASVPGAGCIDFTDKEFSVFTLAVCFAAGGLRGYPNDTNKLFDGMNFTIDLTKNNTNDGAVDKCLGATQKGVKDIKTTLSTNLDGVNHAFVRFDGANLSFTQNGTTETFEYSNFKLQMSASATNGYDTLSNITLHSILLYDRCLTDNEVSAITNYNAERYGS